VRQVGHVKKAAQSVVVHFFDAVNTIEKMEVGKNWRKKVPITLPVIGPNQNTVQSDTSACGRIESRQYFKEGGFCASISAGNENEFSLGKPKIERFQRE
jgi:hypothetical protein